MHLAAEHIDHRVIGTRGAAGQLVRFLDAQSVHHAFHLVKDVAGDAGEIAHQGDDGAVVAVDGVGLGAHRLGLADDGADFGGGGSGFHDDDHFGSSM